MKMHIIGVIGGSHADKKHLELAYETGKLIAQNGAILICGGKQGIMEAACKGARDIGGMTLGILPSDSNDEANQYVDIPIASGIGTARNKIITNTGEAFIAINGRYGTLSEIAYALDAGKTVAGLDSWDIEGVKKAATPDEAIRIVIESLQ